MSKKINLNIKTQLFINLINSGQIILGKSDLDDIKSQIIVKPRIEDNVISVHKKQVTSQIESILNNYLLNLELC